MVNFISRTLQTLFKSVPRRTSRVVEVTSANSPQRQVSNTLIFDSVYIFPLKLQVKTTHVTRKEFLAISNDAEITKLWPSDLSENVPATHLTWEQVNQWINKLNEINKSSWRLPTIEEARTIALFGRNSELLDENTVREESVVWENSGGVLNSVATKKSSPSGIFDVIGNVWTWCSDTEDKLEYDGKFVVPSAGIVGGSFYYSALACSKIPVYKSWREVKSLDIGFRLVSTI